MRNTIPSIKRLIRPLALFLGMAASVPAIAVDIVALNEINQSVQVTASGTATVVPASSSRWFRETDRVTVTAPDGRALEYRFEEIRSKWTDGCMHEGITWGFPVKLFEKTVSTGNERLVGEICATRPWPTGDTVARMRFHIDGNGDYALIFENRGVMRERARGVASISTTLPAFGKSTGITNGLLGNGDFIFQYKDQCLVHSDSGRDAVPRRLNWGGAGLCGLGDVAVIYDNKQAMIKLRKVDDEHYVFLSAQWVWEVQWGWSVGEVYRAGQGCLQANASGTVERTRTSTYDECHTLSDADLKNRPELLWKIKNVDGGTFITNSAHDGVEKCLIFSNRGADVTPTLVNWGAGGEVCGLPRGMFIENGQAVWNLARLD